MRHQNHYSFVTVYLSMTAHQPSARSDIIAERACDNLQAKHACNVRVFTKLPLSKGCFISSSGKPQETSTSRPQEFKFCIKRNKCKLFWDVKRGKSVAVFGKSKADKTPVRSEECSKRSVRK